MTGQAMKTWLIGATALLCSGCIVEDDPESGGGAADMGMADDAGNVDAQPERDARPSQDATLVPDMRPIRDAGPIEDRGTPIDQGQVPDMGDDFVFDTLLLFDDGAMDDDAGTTGADFCGVSADCATAVAASLVLGEGSICQAAGPGCLANRADANAILDDGSACEAATVPSDFVSVGGFGQIAVIFDGDLRGCTVTVVEFAGAIPEAWEGYICDDPDVGSATCLNNDQPVATAPNGGESTFVVPGQ